MKEKIIILAVIFMAVSCQNEAVDNTTSWIQEIDKTILKYERNLQKEPSKSFNDNDVETTIEFYKEDFNNFYKIKVIGYNEGFIDITQEFYVQKDELVMYKMSGISPFIYKGTKKVTDPCCSAFEKMVYFKNKNATKAYTKEIKIMSFDDDNEKHENQLKMLPLIEEDITNYIDAYDSTQRQLEWLKSKVK